MSESKRGSGRTGRRRLTPAEVAVLSPGEQRKWRRRQGLEPRPGAVSGAPAAPLTHAHVPAWLSPRQRELWLQTVLAAPAGLLLPIDAPLVAAYCVELDIFEEAERRRAAADDAKITLEYTRIVRQTAGSLVQLAAALCLTPPTRAKVAPPPQPKGEPVAAAEDKAWAMLRRFPTVISSGRPPGVRKR
jgi:phage terminase small subunit